MNGDGVSVRDHAIRAKWWYAHLARSVFWAEDVAFASRTTRGCRPPGTACPSAFTLYLSFCNGRGAARLADGYA